MSKDSNNNSGKAKSDGGVDVIGIVLMIATPITIIALWQIFSMAGKINPSILPSPLTILETFAKKIASGELQRHLGISMMRVLKGYAIGCLTGVATGTLMGLVRRFERAFTLVFGLIRPVPIIAWVPILILAMGIGEESKVTVIAFGTFFPVLLNTIHGIHSIDRKYLEVAEVLEKKRFTVLFKVVFPSALPAIFTGLRIGLGIAWMSVVGAELIAASSGIGYLISYAGQLSQPAVMLMGVFSIGIIGLLIDMLLRGIERAALRWTVGLKQK